ncbi:hypothetical protein [Tomitella fengzijianii]|uniref:Uncharacterized protein n=1 Tax=Tomitella fengzijianii TaxID=2597660 RepID=A0A516X5B0_9ACTN|nr:hypothetical protein [Tomitella fengzijianii]QDQ98249.1 hypothetical protein FO059_14195 [Tomitella fengzijianii]
MTRNRWIAAAETLVALVAIAMSVWFWNQAVQPASTPVLVEGLPPIEVTMYDGARVTTSIVMMAAAGLAVVDALRRVLTRRR